MQEPINNMISTSNITHIEKYIENNIEKKINQLLSVINFDNSNVSNISNNISNNISDVSNVPNMSNIDTKYYNNYTLHELYKGTIQSIIDIINDVVELLSDRTYISYHVFRVRLFNIFLRNDRKFFIGIILILLSFIIYFIDGSSI